jgi:hypothetical protein
MLRAARSNPQLKIWLDWKNATAANVDAALACLERLDATHLIKSRTLVETGPTAIFAETRRISAAGYTHGYYLPTEAIQQCLGKCTDERWRELAASIITTVNAGGYTAITFDWSASEFVRHWLWDWAAESGISLYSWDMQIDVGVQPDATDTITARLSALPVMGLLVTFPSVFRL